MSPKSAKEGRRRFYVTYIYLLKTEPKNGRRPEKGDFLFKFAEIRALILCFQFKYV
jgi:hypothetical protein